MILSTAVRITFASCLDDMSEGSAFKSTWPNAGTLHTFSLLLLLLACHFLLVMLNYIYTTIIQLQALQYSNRTKFHDI